MRSPSARESPGRRQFVQRSGQKRARDGAAPREAIDCFRRAVAAKSEYPALHSNLIFALNFDPTASAADQQAERAAWAERHASRFTGAIRAHDNDRDPQRRLRIGYVSSHFRRQAAICAFGGVIVNHDPDRFEVI